MLGEDVSIPALLSRTRGCILLRPPSRSLDGSRTSPVISKKLDRTVLTSPDGADDRHPRPTHAGRRTRARSSDRSLDRLARIRSTTPTAHPSPDAGAPAPSAGSPAG